MIVSQSSAPALSPALSRRIFWRIVPLLFVIYVFNYIDRANVGFAALQMNESLGFGPRVYGIGAGIFFVGYLLLTIPANLLVFRIGARAALAGMAVCWGIIAVAMALVSDTTSFFVMRFLLGTAEAGFAPALTLYISQWFPQRERGRAIGATATATYFSIVFGAPVSGAILELPSWFGIASWQWLFILEGFPSVILGFVLWLTLANRPEEAAWLSNAQRAELAQALAVEARRSGGAAKSSAWAAFGTPRVWGFFVVFFACGVGFFALILWLPQIVNRLFAVRSLYVGIITATPFLLSAISAMVGGWHSDRTGRRFRYVIIGAFLGALCFAASAILIQNSALAIVALTAGAVALNSIIGPFWSIVTAFLRGEASAVGIALINAGGIIGGFAGALGLGWLRERSGDFGSGLLVIAACLLVAAVVAAAMARGSAAETTETAPVANRT